MTDVIMDDAADVIHNFSNSNVFRTFSARRKGISLNQYSYVHGIQYAPVAADKSTLSYKAKDSSVVTLNLYFIDVG